MCHPSDFDHIENTLLTEIERATLAREAQVNYSRNPVAQHIGADTMMAIRSDLKNEFENLARRQRGKYIDHTPTAEINTYAVYFRDRDGWVYCWAVEVDEKDQIKHAEELFIFDADNASEAIPPAIADEIRRLNHWHEVMAMDPLNDPRYYNPA